MLRQSSAIGAQKELEDRIRWVMADPRPKFAIRGHDTGLVIGAARKTDSTDLYWRIAQFLMPNHALVPVAFPGDVYHGQAWLPVDDTNCWIFTYSWIPDRPLTNTERTKYATGLSLHAEVDDEYVPVRNIRNDYMIDRESQKTVSYTGIKGVSEQDAAIQDSQGSDSGPHARAPRPDRRRHRRVPQDGHGRGPRAARRHVTQGADGGTAICGTCRRLDGGAGEGYRHRHDGALRPSRWLCRERVRLGRLVTLNSSPR